MESLFLHEKCLISKGIWTLNSSLLEDDFRFLISYIHSLVLLYIQNTYVDKMVALIENPLLIGSLIMTRQRRVSHVCLIFQGKVAWLIAINATYKHTSIYSLANSHITPRIPSFISWNSGHTPTSYFYITNWALVPN